MTKNAGRRAKTFASRGVSTALTFSLALATPVSAYAAEPAGGDDVSSISSVAVAQSDAVLQTVTHDQLAEAGAALDEATAATAEAAEEKAAADAALAESQGAYNRASADLESAKSAKDSADADVINAQAAVDAAQKKVDDIFNSSADLAAVKAALERAQADNEKAQAAKTAAENDLTTAQSAASTAKTAYDAAVAASNEANAACDTASVNYDAAVAAYDAAKAKYDNGIQDLTPLKTALDKASAEQETAQQAYAVAEKAYNDAVATESAAKGEYDVAQLAYSTAAAAHDADVNAKEKAQTAYETAVTVEANAKTAYETAKTTYGYDAAKAAKDSAQAIYDAAKAKCDAAINALNTARTNWRAVKGITYATASHNSDEFFKDMGSEVAYSEVTGKKFDGTNETNSSKTRTDAVRNEIDLDSAADSTSVENMIYAIAMISRYNQVRVSANLSEVGVSDYNMALEQGSVDWSDTNVAHSAGCGNENLAWGYTDPSYGWFYQEKEVFDKEYTRVTGKTEPLTGSDVYSWYNKNYSKCSFESTVGHYVNFTNPNWVTMGMAYDANGSYGNCWGQNFSSSLSAERGTIYTASEYRSRFINWLTTTYIADGMSTEAATEAVNGLFAKADAYVAYGTASSNYSLAYDEKKDAQDALTSAQEAFSSVEAACSSAQDAYNTAAANLAATKTALDTATTKEAASAADVATKKTTCANAAKTYQNAQTVVAPAKTKFDTAHAAYQTAKAASASAQSAYDAVKASNDALTSALSAAFNDKNAAETAQAAAQRSKAEKAAAVSQAAANKTAADDAVSQAQSNFAAATVAAEKTQAVADDAQQAYDALVANHPELIDAMSQLDVAKQALSTKQATAASASADFATKQAAVDQAKNSLDDAQAKADVANVAYSDKSAAKNSAQTTYVDLYNRHLSEGHDWGAWVIKKQATTASAGVQERTCSCCGEVETRAIPKVDPVEKSFPDVPEGTWYHDVASRAAGLGLIEGYDNGTFGPDNTLTRAQAATILWRYYEPEAAAAYDEAATAASVNTTRMPDVASGQWYTAAADWAVEAGVISGKDQADGSKLFDPDGTITREQLCAIVANASAKYAGADVEGADQTKFGSMPDASSVDGWAVDSVAWGLNHQVISGKSDTYIAPLDSVTRAEMAAVLMNSLDGGLLG